MCESNKSIILFDVDGTLVESGSNITTNMVDILYKLSKKYELGIVGGGEYNKIIKQLQPVENIITHFFCESGSIYYYKGMLRNINDIRITNCYDSINNLKKIALKFLSNVDYQLSGHFIDQRISMVYISLIGLQANQKERNYFIDLDKKNKYREQLYNLLVNNNTDQNIVIQYGGAVGIAIIYKDWDKSQILQYFDNNTTIYYFGDKYEKNGNDYNIINHPRVSGYKVNNYLDTINIIENKFII